jgi:hypothetical protein
MLAALLPNALPSTSLHKRNGLSAGEAEAVVGSAGRNIPARFSMYARYPPIPLNSGLERVTCFDSASGLIRPVPPVSTLPAWFEFVPGNGTPNGLVRSESRFKENGRFFMPRIKAEGRLSRPTFEERTTQAAKDLEDQAWRLPPGCERDGLLRRARQMETASHMQEWLMSPGLKPPE